jgi:S1-C subfamily serine protease
MDEPVVNAASAPDVPDPTTGRLVPPPGALFRQDVTATVEEGLGYFLQRVSVDPEVIDGKFQGFRIVELRPVEWWQGVDLRPGDVITMVNGMPIERDIDAYQAFQSLRSAPALRVTFLRGGARRELVYSIIDQNGKSGVPKPKAAPPAPAEAPKAPPAKRSG